MPVRVEEWSQRTWWRPGVRVAAALAPLATSALLFPLRGEITSATAVLLLVVVVVAAAAAGDRAAGVLAAVSSALWFDFFLTEPYLSFTIAGADDVEAAVLLVVISLAVTEIALWGARQQRQASRRSGYLDGVVDTARAVVDGSLPAAGVHDVVARRIADVLGIDDCRYVAGPVRDARTSLLDHDGVLTRSGHALDVDRSGLPTDEFLAVPVRRGPEVVGHFLGASPTRVTRPTREQRRVAAVLADQVAALPPTGAA